MNNRKLRALRTEPMYETILTDLFLIGALDRSVVEKLIGHPVAETLVNPLDGSEPPVAEAQVDPVTDPATGDTGAH